MKLNQILKDLMAKERLSLVELAKRSKVPKQTLHNWLSGADPKNVDQIRDVANTFGLTIEELCYGEKPKRANHNLNEFENEINAGIFEVVLRRIKK